MWRLMCRANWQSQRVRYFLRPTKLRWSRKENLKEGTYTQTPGVGFLANTIDGPERPTPLHFGPTKTSAKDLARSRSVRIGVVRFEKSLVANLSAKRQLSVAKLSAKRIFSLAKRGIYFSRKWPDGGRFFEPCVGPFFLWQPAPGAPGLCSRTFRKRVMPLTAKCLQLVLTDTSCPWNPISSFSRDVSTRTRIGWRLFACTSGTEREHRDRQPPRLGSHGQGRSYYCSFCFFYPRDFVPLNLTFPKQITWGMLEKKKKKKRSGRHVWCLDDVVRMPATRLSNSGAKKRKWPNIQYTLLLEKAWIHIWPRLPWAWACVFSMFLV